MDSTDRQQFKSFAINDNSSSFVVASTLAMALLLSLFAVPAALAQTYSVIHNFSGAGADGANPEAGVTIRAGSLFGTTAAGGITGVGTVYQSTLVGSNWITSPILNFAEDGSGGLLPTNLAFGPDGHLYGTTYNGGNHNDGVIFYLTAPASICKTLACYWTETLPHQFGGAPSDGQNPYYGGLVWDQQGNAYGTTAQGGSNSFGTVYQLTKSGSTWIETPIYSFAGSADGAYPTSGVIRDAAGNLFGTTKQGGSSNFGTVFKLAYVGGQWTKTTLYNFQDGFSCDGKNPKGLTMDSSGNLYGASDTDVEGVCTGWSAFAMYHVGDNYIFDTVYSTTSVPFQCGTVAPLTLDAAGNLYGSTDCDGEFEQGTVFELVSQNNFQYNALHSFNGSDGAYAGESGVTIAADGTLYGTTRLGGTQGHGVLWMIKR